MNAHPDDIVVVGRMDQRALYRQFSDRQVIATATAHRLQGRRFRYAWITPEAIRSPQWGRVRDELDRAAWRSEGELRNVRYWQPESGSLVERIEALPMHYRSDLTNDDWLLGYQRAVDDVLNLISREAAAITKSASETGGN